MRKQAVAIVSIVFVLFSCKQLYKPDIESSNESYLVVEGNLNPGTDSTIIRLTKTFKLDDTARLTTVNGAQLTVEGADNSLYVLTNTGGGYYSSPLLPLSIGQEYRLHIVTVDGKEYLSDYVKARDTPDIDSINWIRTGDGVRIYANTHDPSGESQYYQWGYIETWEHHSPFPSSYIYDAGIDAIRPRVFPQENVYTCWTTIPSSRIVLANSTRLQSDVISKAPLIFIGTGDDRISVRYSVLVSQYVLSKKAYEYYELLKRNTEDIGSFFGPLPSETSGNIHCVSDPGEPVIGFLNSCVVKRERIFITHNQVFPWQGIIRCSEQDKDTVPNIRSFIDQELRQGLLVIDYLTDPPNSYTFSFRRCVDCRENGGVTVRPSFW